MARQESIENRECLAAKIAALPLPTRMSDVVEEAGQMRAALTGEDARLKEVDAL